MISVIKINPFEKTITSIEIEAGNLRDYYHEIDCQTIDCVGIGKGDGVFCDDEALLQAEQPPAFRIQGRVIHGIGLVVGSDNEGESIAPIHSISEIQTRVEFLGKLPYQEPQIYFIPL